MRRGILFLMAILLLCTLSLGVSAVTSASGVNSFATVSADGSCQVSLAVTLHLEQTVDKLLFPVPRAATAISVNGSRVSTTVSGESRRIDLSRVIGNMVGDFSVNIQYTLPAVIQATENDTLQLQLPLLSGFAYSVEALSFSVSLPGAVSGLPGFSSGYHQAGIEEHLTYSVEGATITGNSLKAMKDHETLVMTLAVTEEMFPRSIVETQSVVTAYIGMGICAGAALLYWCIALRSLPWRRKRDPEPPQGFVAGQLGCILTLEGVDLSMTVLSWAQLGYILIQIDRHGKVVLHKRMDMGNERSDFERGCFKKLFGKRQSVDTSALRYAQLSRHIGKRPAGVRELMHPKTGNRTVFRVLAALIGLFGGAGMGLSLGSGAVLQGFFVVVLAVAGGASSFFMLPWLCGMCLRDRKQTVPALALGAFWLLLGLIAGEFTLGLWTVLGTLLAGAFYALAGRRTELGRQTRAQVLGLRRFLRKPDERLHRLCESDPDYFFRMLPYALALGVDKPFAKHFGGSKLDRCPYLTTGMDAHMNASAWAALIRKAVSTMDDRANKLPLEKLLGILHSITRP